MAVPAVGPSPRRWRRTEHLAAAGLFCATIAVFWPVLGHRFIASFDDLWYVTGNAVVAKGLSAEGLRWAFASVGYASNWHPLTWLSHMLDVQLFGMAPGGHHMTSVLIHAAGAALLFRVLGGMTGAVGRSAVVAALFALHPLRAESVAWVAERKDVLSGLLWMLALLAYLRWVRLPRPGRALAVVAAFALGLLSKPMLVTLPFVLLLLDFWPLGRLRLPAGGPFGASRPAGVPFLRLVLEKAPLFALSAASSAVTLVAQAGALGRIPQRPLDVRFLNAVHSYGVYLRKAVWPTDLMFFYPHPGEGLNLWHVLGAGALLVAISAVAVLTRRSRPYLLTGWLWYLGVLVPVIGLIQQSGAAAMADRYTYLPLIGISLAVVWGGHALFPASRRAGWALAGVAAAACLMLAVLTTRQVQTMRDDESVYRHMLSVDPASVYARNSLGAALIGQGRRADAVSLLSGMYRPDPLQAAGALMQRGEGLAMSGKAAEALECYTNALALDPGNAAAARAVALLHAAGVRMPPGRSPSRTARELIDEEEARLWLRQGDFLAASEHFEYALDYYRQAVQLKPDFADAWNNLGSCYGRLGRHREAAEAFEKTLAADPDNEHARKNLGQARRSLRR